MEWTWLLGQQNHVGTSMSQLQRVALPFQGAREDKTIRALDIRRFGFNPVLPSSEIPSPLQKTFWKMHV